MSAAGIVIGDILQALDILKPFADILPEGALIAKGLDLLEAEGKKLVDEGETAEDEELKAKLALRCMTNWREAITAKRQT